MQLFLLLVYSCDCWFSLVEDFFKTLLTRATAGTTVKIHWKRDNLSVVVHEEQWRPFLHLDLSNETFHRFIFAELPCIKLGVRVNHYDAMTDLCFNHIARAFTKQHVQVVVLFHPEDNSHTLEHCSTEDSYGALISVFLPKPSCIWVTQVSPCLRSVWLGDLDSDDHGTHTSDL